MNDYGPANPAPGTRLWRLRNHPNTVNEPRTEAGKRLLDKLDRAGYLRDALIPDIIAIEAEAATPAETGPTCCELACYEDEGCACEGCTDPASAGRTVKPTPAETGLREATLSGLTHLLTFACDCPDHYTERGRHAPDCRHQFIHDYLDDAEIAAILAALSVEERP